MIEAQVARDPTNATILDHLPAFKKAVALTPIKLWCVSDNEEGLLDTSLCRTEIFRWGTSRVGLKKGEPRDSFAANEIGASIEMS